MRRDDLEFSIMDITPKMAREVLAYQDRFDFKNRHISPSTVEELADDMVNGRWVLNGATVIIDPDGCLIDGQHRLSACVLANRPFETLLVRGLDKSIFPTIDGGKPRSAADVLNTLGESNVKTLAAALNIVHQYYSKTFRSGLSKGLRNTMAEEVLKKYPDIINSVKLISHLHSQVDRLIVPPSILTALHYIFSRKDKNAADDYVEKVASGFNLSPGMPEYILRSKMIGFKMKNISVSRASIVAFCIRAWNAKRRNKSVKSLRWVPEYDIPKIL